MRALLDANVYISSLLTRNATTPPRAAVNVALDGAYKLLISAGVIDEVRRKTATKPYLASRIDQAEVERLVQGLLVIAEIVPELDPPFPKIGDDRKDDYLFAHAIAGQANYLVSGDTGVQKVGRIGDVQIVSPAGFIQVLSDAGLIPANPRDWV